MGKTAALFAVAVAAVMWAGSGMAAQHFFAHSDKSALELSNIRMSLAGLLLLLVARQSGGLARGVKVLREKPRLMLDLVLYAIVGIFLVQFTYFQSISVGNAAAATVIEYTCPAMVICWEALRAWKWPKPGEAAAVVTATLGIFLLVTGGDTEKLLVPLACLLWGLLSSACFAFAAIYPRHLLLEFDPYFLLAVGLLIGGAGSSFFVGTLDWRPFFAPEVVFDIGFIVVCGTALAFVLFNAGLLYLSSEQATVTATIEPAASVLLASVLFGTRFGAVELLGVGMVLAAILMPVLPVGKMKR